MERDSANNFTSLCRNIDTSIEPHLMELEDLPWGRHSKIGLKIMAL
ncbi:MAG: hypothetical protein FWB85_01495 [Chitinispirillia bacterium]|nr:hypothetical protein [Chitinispirillia bacterium]